MLTETLRDLERDGLVARHTYAEAPPRGVYELTELGGTLHEPMRELATGRSGTSKRCSRHTRSTTSFACRIVCLSVLIGPHRS